MESKILHFVELNRMIHSVFCVTSKSKYKQYYHAIMHDLYLALLRMFYPEEIKKIDELFKNDNTQKND